LFLILNFFFYNSMYQLISSIETSLNEVNWKRRGNYWYESKTCHLRVPTVHDIEKKYWFYYVDSCDYKQYCNTHFTDYQVYRKIRFTRVFS
jgi:hypothetical protein